MSGKIAVIINENNKLTSLETGTTLILFSKQDYNWQKVKEISYKLDITSKISEIRDNIRALILQLEDCKIVVGKSITGLSYNIFERMGFEIFEAETLSSALLEEIQSDLAAETGFSPKEAAAIPTTPVGTSEPGVFFLDLIKLQEKYPEISSKKALQSFIETNPFYRLDVVCSHIPPWFEVILPKKNLNYIIKGLDKHRVQVSISQKLCKC